MSDLWYRDAGALSGLESAAPGKGLATTAGSSPDSDGRPGEPDSGAPRRRDQERAERLVRRFLRLCEHPRTAERMRRSIRATVIDGPESQRALRLTRFLVEHRLAQRSSVQESALRWQLVASQLVGVAMMRYEWRIEPIASEDLEALVRRTAPMISAALTD